MSSTSKTPTFGNKGPRDTAQSYAESLLTGNPVGRARRKRRLAVLRPRPKPIFGRKDSAETSGNKATMITYFVPSLVVCGFCLAVVAQIIVAS